MAVTAGALPTGKKPRWWQKYRNQYILLGLLFVLPALINFAVFRYYPMIWAFRTSLWEYSLMRGFTEFVGFDHYVRAFTGDPRFWESMRATFYYVVGKVPLTIILALALAAFANQERRGMGVMRALIFVPVVRSFVVVAIVWGMVLNYNVGLMNAMLQNFGLARIEFLTNPDNVMPTIIGISLWKDVGYSVIIFVAGMRGISQEFYDAATVDGANIWQRFFYVTLPMLRRHLLFVSVISTLGAFQVFVPVYQLASQQRVAQVIVFYIYRLGFIFGEMGYASALSVILLVLLLLLSVLQIRIMRSDDV
jgi:multiple sugar transport system permease protein